ncbi:hypothetical protein HMPREF0494_0412 [Limosilactobacillus antri DSM 16041]|uniref:Uncharacterized protein n=1 Tax=Limosilactobacillus antri DSM 16041 TaxID=525309 RepID=C8P518_9LACO|nr:hypothetical protein HMPREF0494_0412 [Limosilactobacillus antri DSM 16041]
MVNIRQVKKFHKILAAVQYTLSRCVTIISSEAVPKSSNHSPTL